MSITHSALILLVFFWSLQVAASWVQWRHYRHALGDATRAADGFLGVGQHRPRLGRGALALLEADPDGHVRQLRTMSGWSVFARLRDDAAVVGWPLARLAAQCEARDDAAARAIGQAIAQIDSVRSRRDGAAPSSP